MDESSNSESTQSSYSGQPEKSLNKIKLNTLFNFVELKNYFTLVFTRPDTAIDRLDLSASARTSLVWIAITSFLGTILPMGSIQYPERFSLLVTVPMANIALALIHATFWSALKSLLNVEGRFKNFLSLIAFFQIAILPITLIKNRALIGDLSVELAKWILPLLFLYAFYRVYRPRIAMFTSAGAIQILTYAFFVSVVGLIPKHRYAKKMGTECMREAYVKTMVERAGIEGSSESLDELKLYLINYENWMEKVGGKEVIQNNLKRRPAENPNLLGSYKKFLCLKKLVGLLER